MSFFSSLKPNKPKRTSFDLSHEVKLTCDFGQLVPFFVQDVIPGDTFKVSVETLVRFAPMIAPIMHRVNVFTHFFFVPYRLVWDEWREFITGGEDGTAEPVFPRCYISRDYSTDPEPAGGVLSNGSLLDFMGFPTENDHSGHSQGYDIAINLLPFRAYQLIYNEYYRDQNLQEEIDFSKSSGIFDFDKPNGRPDVDGCMECLVLRNRCWEKDYFTSCLPFPQRLPNPVTVPVNGDVNIFASKTGNNQSGIFVRNDGSIAPDGYIENKSGYGLRIYDSNSSIEYPGFYDPRGTLKGEFSDNSNITVNELRRAFSLQRWLENNARAGSRYIEQIFSHFGVRSSDARLQRPEYLGGGKTPVVISEVMQTSETGNSPQGNLAGAGVSYGTSHSFKRFFEEHGIVIGILSIMPRSSYQNGLPRLFAKFDKFDYYFPEFAHLGEQEVKNYEVYTNTYFNVDKGSNDKVFGYLPRYAEYRYVNSHVHGLFRHDLNFWHLGRIFDNQPNLNNHFVECTHGSLDRIFAVQDAYEDRLWVQMYVKFNALRPLPKYGTPGL